MTTREKVLQELTNNKNSSVSGQQIADACGVSRAAIWKAINSLRQEGWQISGTTNGGYILNENSDVFSKELFCEYLDSNYKDLTGGYGKVRIECFKEIDSTNTYAKRILTEDPSIKTAIIVSESQTAGRGRLGRTFYSPMNTGIYLTVIYSPEGGVSQPARLTASSAVAVCRAVKKIYGVECAIKWINDIFAHGKKVCGILTEGFTNFETGLIESAIIGIGINIKDNPDCFPDDVKKIAGGINSDDEKSVLEGSRCSLAAEVAAQVLQIMKEDVAKVMAEYKALSFLIGTELSVYPVAGGPDYYKAKAVDIDENAGLVVELADGTRKTLSSGEVTLKSSNF
ncbi:MAG: biotin--[acetyl-CoA-carboxylase] ligase [Treponema sp.]|nr:biotin--[acetyl-CoA-carboxylase] ligase [Treponema sp.]